jgi:predicted metalloprotease with PDZ domain
LRDSSFDTWIKFYRPDENSRNTRISYYAKGAVAAFLLDMKIRSLTDNEKSLDDVMRKMFSKYSKKGFTSEQFRRVAGQVAGENLDDWFENAIDSTNELEFDSSLKFMGINIPKASAKMDEEKKAKKVSRSAPATIGASFSGSRISRVTPDSQAWRLGMVSGDEVVAINGFRLSGSFSDRLRQYEIGDQIELLISRDDLLFSETVTLEARKTEDWAISWRSNPSKDQKQRIAAWLETEGGQTDKKKDGDEQEEVGKSSDEAPKKKRKRRRKKPLKS